MNLSMQLFFVMKSRDFRSLRAKEIAKEIEWQKSSTARCETCRLRNSTLSLTAILFLSRLTNEKQALYSNAG